MEKAQYRVKQGQNFGARKQLEAGAIVELTEEEAAGFLDKVELVGEGKATPKAANTLTEGGFHVTSRAQTGRPDLPTAFDNLRTAILAASEEELIALPGIGEKSVDALRAWAAGDELQTAEATAQVEKELEAETGKDFTQTGNQPPTLAETDKAVTDATATTGESAPVTPPLTHEQGSGNDNGASNLTTVKDAEPKDTTPKGTGKSKP